MVGRRLTDADIARDGSKSAEVGAVDTLQVESNLDADALVGADDAELRGGRLRRVLVFVALPIVAFAVAAAAGYLKWESGSLDDAQTAASESVKAASDGTVRMLSYRSDTVEQQLEAASDQMTGSFRDEYTKLINDVVIPGAKEKNISSVATVPAASSVSSSDSHAVVLLFVNQTVVIGTEPPTSTASSVRVTLDKQHGRWLVSAFEPV